MSAAVMGRMAVGAGFATEGLSVPLDPGAGLHLADAVGAGTGNHLGGRIGHGNNPSFAEGSEDSFANGTPGRKARTATVAKIVPTDGAKRAREWPTPHDSVPWATP